MNLLEIINHVNTIKPNAFPDENKCVWLNEVEGMLQTEVFLWEPAASVFHRCETEWSGKGMWFPDERTVCFPSAVPVGVGGVLTVEDAVDYGENNVSAVVAAVSPDRRRVTVSAPAFSAVGETPESGEAAVSYDGSGEEMLLPPVWHKLYYTYLEAMVDFAHGEYNKYQNTMALFNSYVQSFTRWYGQNIAPADHLEEARDPLLPGYRLAVRNGFSGTKAEYEALVTA